MPRAINEELLKTRNDDGSPNPHALAGFDKGNPPTKEIPFLEYPRCVYRYPKSPTQEIVEVRAGQTFTSVVPVMALSKIVQNKHEFEKAIKEGWHKDPYVPPVVDEALANPMYE